VESNTRTRVLPNFLGADSGRLEAARWRSVFQIVFLVLAVLTLRLEVGDQMSDCACRFRDQLHGRLLVRPKDLVNACLYGTCLILGE
jgi:hypothetical protein